LGSSPDEERAIAAALTELEGRRKEVAALKDLVGAKNAHIQALEAIIANQADQIATWKRAVEARTEANTLDDRIKANYDESVKAYKDEVSALRRENGRVKTQRNVLGAVVVAIIAVLAVAGGGGD
jgi:chromosome segregation ATPase